MTEETTALAAVQRGRLRKSLGLVDMVLLSVSVVVGLDTIGQVAKSGGAQALTWTVVLTALFVVPYMLLTAEVGSAFPQEGGPYVWVRLVFGRFIGGLNTMFYWVTNPIWLGGSLAVASATAFGFIHPLAGGSAGDWIVRLAFIWISILATVVSLRVGKWVPNIGALIKVTLVGFFLVSVVIYAGEHGVHGFGAGDFAPSTGGFLAVVPLLLFSLVGFEAQSGAAEEMRDPRRDVPKSVVRSGVLSVLCYLVPIGAVLIVLPDSQINGLSGFLTAIQTVFSVYGGASGILLKVAAVAFILSLVNSGSGWILTGDRVLAVAAADGALPPFFAQINARLGTPVRANLLSGVLATAFMAASELLTSGSAAATFAVVLNVAISTTVISYILMFPAFALLRRGFPDTPRPYTFPFGTAGLLIATAVTTGWVVLGAWIAVFPGTMDRLLGQSYDFSGTWSMSRNAFELFTLGTLAVIVALSIAGYALGAATRTQPADEQVGVPSPVALSLMRPDVNE